MINKFIIYFIFLCFSFPTLAACFNAQEFKDTLLKEHGEKSKWIGLAEIDVPTKQAIVLFENPDKKNWTLAIYHINKNAMCVFATGSFAQTLSLK